MKDNFSLQASGYSKFRPSYPKALIERIAGLVPAHEMALDVATGNGQVALMLADYFQTVYATDISEKQLSHAPVAINVIYREMPAEQLDFEDGQFDLITVAQAVHWFDFSLFYDEVYRTLKPGGIIAVMGYGLMHSNPASDAVIRRFYDEVIGPYWDAERKWLDENYETIPFPFEEMHMEKFENRLNWTFDQLIGYLETWSAVSHYKAHFNENPIDLIREELQTAWEGSDGTIVFPILTRIGRCQR